MATFQNSINQGFISGAANSCIIGTDAGKLGTTGGANTIIGNLVADSITTSNRLVIIGSNCARQVNATATASVIIGNEAALTGQPQNGTFVGCFASRSSGNTINCSAFGYNAGGAYGAATTGCTAIGSSTQQNTSGNYNTACGYGSQGSGAQSGTSNCAFGVNTQLKITSGSDNQGCGRDCQINLTSGARNFAAGTNAQYGDAGGFTGSDNISLGYQSLTAISSATNNVSIGSLSGDSITSGSHNLFLGYNAGSVPTTQSSNIYLMNVGAAEANTIRIGTEGTGNGQQNTCYIAGIVNATLTTPVGTVILDANGKLAKGTAANVFNWIEVTGTSENAVSGTGYIANNAAMVTITLPSTFALGDVIEVAGKGAGLFTVAANTGDTISIVGPTAAGYTTSAGGTLVGNDQYGHLRLIALTANSAWIAIPTGNFTVT